MRFAIPTLQAQAGRTPDGDNTNKTSKLSWATKLPVVVRVAMRGGKQNANKKKKKKKSWGSSSITGHTVIESPKNIKQNNGLIFGSLRLSWFEASPGALRPTASLGMGTPWRVGTNHQGVRGWAWAHERYAKQHILPSPAAVYGGGGGGSLDLRGYRAHGWACKN